MARDVLKERSMDMETAHYLSKSFLNGYYRCRGVGKDGFELPKRADASEADKAPIPAIVCLAFSIEVGLKAIIKAEGKAPPRCHDLQKLFGLLTQDSQMQIRQALSRYADKFDSLLTSMKSAFEDWRYVYEAYEPSREESNSALSFSDDFLVSFAEAVVAAFIQKRKN